MEVLWNAAKLKSNKIIYTKYINILVKKEIPTQAQSYGFSFSGYEMGPDHVYYSYIINM
jgi:hypothetical protein